MLPGIKMNLPESTTSESTSNLGITITAEKNGALWFNEKSVTFSTLPNELSSFDTGKVKKEDFPVSIEADFQVTNGTVVKILDVIRSCGFASVNLRTKTK